MGGYGPPCIIYSRLLCHKFTPIATNDPTPFSLWRRKQTAPGLALAWFVAGLGTNKRGMAAADPPDLRWLSFPMQPRAHTARFCSHTEQAGPCRKSLASFPRYLPAGEGHNQNNGVYTP